MSAPKFYREEVPGRTNYFPMGVARTAIGVHRCPNCGLVNRNAGELEYNLQLIRCTMCDHTAQEELFWVWNDGLNAQPKGGQ